MIEYTIKNDLDLFLVTFCYEIFQIVIVSKTAVELSVVRGLISMSYGFK